MRNLILSIFMLLLTSCAGVTVEDGARTVVIGGVLTGIQESEQLTSEVVLSTVEEIRSRIDLNGDITADELLLIADSVIDLSDYDARTQFIISELMRYVERAIRSRDLDPEEVRTTADQFLSWVTTAAILAQSDDSDEGDED